MLCCTLFNNVVLHPVNNCCQQPLFTVVHVQQPLFNHCWQRSTSFFNQLLSAHVPTTLQQLLLSVNIEQLLIEQYSSTLWIQQVLLNIDNNIVQALFNEQRCINLINFCACILGNNRRVETAEASPFQMLLIQPFPHIFLILQRI